MLLSSVHMPGYSRGSWPHSFPKTWVENEDLGQSGIIKGILKKFIIFLINAMEYKLGGVFFRFVSIHRLNNKNIL